MGQWTIPSHFFSAFPPCLFPFFPVFFSFSNLKSHPLSTPNPLARYMALFYRHLPHWPMPRLVLPVPSSAPTFPSGFTVSSHAWECCFHCSPLSFPEWEPDFFPSRSSPPNLTLWFPTSRRIMSDCLLYPLTFHSITEFQQQAPLSQGLSEVTFAN